MTKNLGLVLASRAVGEAVANLGGSDLCESALRAGERICVDRGRWTPFEAILCVKENMNGVFIFSASGYTAVAMCVTKVTPLAVLLHLVAFSPDSLEDVFEFRCSA